MKSAIRQEAAASIEVDGIQKGIGQSQQKQGSTIQQRGKGAGVVKARWKGVI